MDWNSDLPYASIIAINIPASSAAVFPVASSCIPAPISAPTFLSLMISQLVFLLLLLLYLFLLPWWFHASCCCSYCCCYGLWRWNFAAADVTFPVALLISLLLVLQLFLLPMMTVPFVWYSYSCSFTESSSPGWWLYSRYCCTTATAAATVYLPAALLVSTPTDFVNGWSTNTVVTNCLIHLLTVLLNLSIWGLARYSVHSTATAL